LLMLLWYSHGRYTIMHSSNNVQQEPMGFSNLAFTTVCLFLFPDHGAVCVTCF
jgi:hypothetical protein